MKWFNKRKVIKWLRIIHRDLGFFVIGMTLVYAVSGIILNHKQLKQDPAFKTIQVEETTSAMMTVSEFKLFFGEKHPEYTLNKIIPNDTVYLIFVKGGLGKYIPETGLVKFEVYQKRPIVYFINKLHNNQKDYWTTPADFFAAAMIFLAVSSIFMLRGKKSFAGRGKWYVLAGVILVIVYIWI